MSASSQESGRARSKAGVWLTIAVLGLAVLLCVVLGVAASSRWSSQTLEASPAPVLKPRLIVDDSGLTTVQEKLRPWRDPTSLTEIRDAFDHIGHRMIEELDAGVTPGSTSGERIYALRDRGLLHMFEGEPAKAYEDWSQLRAIVEQNPEYSAEWLSTVIFLQGVAGLRQGESENCIHCRGEGACLFPILPTAIHQQREGSEIAVRHFTEYLHRHPDDRGVVWLLNVAHMTLGQYPQEVPAEYLLPLAGFRDEAEQSIGKFRDIGHLVGVNRLNQAGGAIMEDFDNDGLLDIVASSMDTAMPLAYYHNQGDGTFEDRAQQAGLKDQLGGLNCVQCDYNNDGWMDLFVIRGAWFRTPMRPSLLKNNGDGTFSDVTQQARLMEPMNAIFARWADYDNDGDLDLFVGCEQQRNRLFRNNGRGAFDEIAELTGLAGKQKFCRGASWGDFDGDGDADLYVNYLDAPPQLFRNEGRSGFRDVARELKLNQPQEGFSCWFWDYDNDGWLDIYATSYRRDLSDAVRGLLGEPHEAPTDRLYRNLEGKAFEDVTQAAGLDIVLGTMGSNFADFDNDGYLDFYLATGWPGYSALVPNRMFRNVQGKRFAEITISSRTGHLQKGHGVACGDWDRDGHVDIFVEIGGATPGDVFHNALFQNPAQDANHWLNVKLVGAKSNRAAIGARIKVITAGPKPQTIYRHVDSGSSFGANPLEQHIGLGTATNIATLEVYWPASRVTQQFHNIDADQALEIKELGETFRVREYRRVPPPQDAMTP